MILLNMIDITELVAEISEIIGQIHLIRTEKHTCSECTSEDPALAVSNRLALVFMVFLQDFHTSTPNCRAVSKCIVSWPVSFHNPAVVWRINLERQTFFPQFLIYIYTLFSDRKSLNNVKNLGTESDIKQGFIITVLQLRCVLADRVISPWLRWFAPR